jgi:hypothetical protein
MYVGQAGYTGRCNLASHSDDIDLFCPSRRDALDNEFKLIFRHTLMFLEAK